ncbi:hypothetical protein G6F42_019628 [Rhizopus arrhizus]|nr:hypothetical protein G6F42_019628 [Rhizopus arrhizus]
MVEITQKPVSDKSESIADVAPADVTVMKEETSIEQLETLSYKENSKLNKVLVRKLDKRLLPLLCVLYLLSYIDRSNIGNAKLGGLEEDLNMSKSQYQWSLSIFYFSYVIFDLPSNIIMRRWRPSYWLGILMFCWGAVATAMAASTSFAGLAICRFLLGLFEAGFFPGVIYFMSLWYTRKEYGRRIGFFC